MKENESLGIRDNRGITQNHVHSIYIYRYIPELRENKYYPELAIHI